MGEEASKRREAGMGGAFVPEVFEKRLRLENVRFWILQYGLHGWDERISR